MATAKPTAPRAAWERRAGEPHLWFDRFDRYRLAGPKRSLNQLYEDERRAEGSVPADRKRGGLSAPAIWRKQALAWEWRQRAEAWDRSEQERRQREYEEERLERREHRRRVDRALEAKLIQALQLLDPAQAKWSDVVAGLRAAHAEERIEYGDDPAQRTEISGPGGGALKIEVVYVDQDIDKLKTERAAEEATKNANL